MFKRLMSKHRYDRWMFDQFAAARGLDIDEGCIEQPVQDPPDQRADVKGQGFRQPSSLPASMALRPCGPATGSSLLPDCPDCYKDALPPLRPIGGQRSPIKSATAGSAMRSFARPLRPWHSRISSLHCGT